MTAMSPQQNPHWGTTLDEFLAEEGIRESAKAESLTRSFNGLAQSRVSSDAEFAQQMLRAGSDAMLAGDVDTGKAILRDYSTLVAAPAGVRSELWIMAELARRLEAPSTFSADPHTVFTELRAASAGGLADYSGIDYALLDSGAEAYWPYPAGGPGTPRLFPGLLCPLRWPGPAGSRGPGRNLGPGPALWRGIPGPGHGPAAGALPIRRADPSRAGTLRSVPHAQPLHPSPGRGRPRDRRRRLRHRGERARHGDVHGPDQRHRPAGHRVPAVPLCRGRVCKPAHEPGRRPHLRDARVQGQCRDRDGVGRTAPRRRRGPGVAMPGRASDEGLSDAWQCPAGMALAAREAS